jgi:hypothetical protein
MSMDKCLLSIILTARNDNYTPDYLKRLSYVINFNCQNIKDLGLSDKIKIEIVDWGSEDQISNVLSVIDKDFNKIIKFIHVEKKITDEFDNYSIGNFFVELACNVGFRRSESEFILQCPADQILSINSLQNLYNFLLKEKERDTQKFYLLHRKILDNFFYHTNFFEFKSLNEFLNNHNFLSYQFPDNRPYYGGGVGGLIIKKDDLIKIKGYEENNIFRGRYGGADNLTVKKLFKFLKLEELVSKGICMYKLPYSPLGKRIEDLKKNNKIFELKNYLQFSYNFDSKKYSNRIDKLNLNTHQLKEEEWGLGNLNIPLKEKKIQVNKRLFDFTKDSFIIKSSKVNFTNFLRVFNVWFIQKDTFLNFTVLVNILICLIKFNIISFVELGSNKFNKILSISKIFPFLKIIIFLEKSSKFGDSWFFLSSNMCATHKGYFKAVDYKNKFDLIEKNFILELNDQKFSNFISLEKINDDLNLSKTLTLIENSKDLIGLILVKNDLKVQLLDKLNSNFKILTSFGSHFLMINSELYSNELKNNYLENKLKKKTILYMYIVINILRPINLLNYVKSIVKKKIKKWK